jgi:hypothetical protein
MMYLSMMMKTMMRMTRGGSFPCDLALQQFIKLIGHIFLSLAAPLTHFVSCHNNNWCGDRCSHHSVQRDFSS